MNDTLQHTDDCVSIKVASCADTGWTCFLSSLWYIWTYTWVTKKVYFALLFFFFVNLVSSSLCMSIHIKLYQRPTYTSLSNKYQARSRYNWLAQILPASRGQLYNREQPASWIIMKWHHRLAWVLSFRYSVSCLCLLWSMWIAVLLGICRNKKFSLCLPSGPD